jgi:hypothetical protein
LTAFVVRLLALLAGLPLLLPTGVCICNVGPDCCAPVSVVAAESHDCCDDCQEPADPKPDSKDDHVPSCPAEQLDGSQWTKPSPTPGVDAVPSAVATLETPIAFVRSSAVFDDDSDPTGSLPRYLSYCAFLL